MSWRNCRIWACGLGASLALSVGSFSGSQAAAQEAFIHPSGGVSDMLIIGPIDPGRCTNSNGRCSDGGRLEIVDYLSNADGTVDETNILVAEGDDVEPDFGGVVDALGVKIAVNRAINDRGDLGVLTVWRAEASLDGYIDYNNADGPIAIVSVRMTNQKDVVLAKGDARVLLPNA